MSVFQLQEFWAVILHQNYSTLFMEELCCIEIKVKAGDSEEFDHGALIVGNIDNANPPVNKICIGNCYYFKIVIECALCLL